MLHIFCPSTSRGDRKDVAAVLQQNREVAEEHQFSCGGEAIHGVRFKFHLGSFDCEVASAKQRGRCKSAACKSERRKHCDLGRRFHFVCLGEPRVDGGVAAVDEIGDVSCGLKVRVCVCGSGKEVTAAERKLVLFGCEKTSVAVEDESPPPPSPISFPKLTKLST